jgi:hypothetical protein
MTIAEKIESLLNSSVINATFDINIALALSVGGALGGLCFILALLYKAVSKGLDTNFRELIDWKELWTDLVKLFFLQTTTFTLITGLLCGVIDLVRLGTKPDRADVNSSYQAKLAEYKIAQIEYQNKQIQSGEILWGNNKANTTLGSTTGNQNDISVPMDLGGEWIYDGLNYCLSEGVMYVGVAMKLLIFFLFKFAIMFGPFSLALSILPMCSDGFNRWLSITMGIGFSFVTIDMLDRVVISTLSAELDILNTKDTIGLTILNIVLFVCYISVFTMTSWWVGKGEGGRFLQTTMQSAVIMAGAAKSVGGGLFSMSQNGMDLLTPNTITDSSTSDKVSKDATDSINNQ